MRVLIVDDDSDCRQIVALMLSKLGWTLRFAENGAEGLAVARDWRPDLVLMDVLMPAMTGHEAARGMRAEPALAGTVLIAITALAFEQDRQDAFAAGFDAVLTKPFSRKQLHAVIRRHFPELGQLQDHQVPA